MKCCINVVHIIDVTVKWGVEIILEEIMATFFPNLMKIINPQIHEAE
jgi:hypothetical protein